MMDDILKQINAGEVSVPRAVRDQLLDSGRRSDAYLDLRRVFSVRRSENVKATAEQILSILQRKVAITDISFIDTNVKVVKSLPMFSELSQPNTPFN